MFRRDLGGERSARIPILFFDTCTRQQIRQNAFFHIGNPEQLIRRVYPDDIFARSTLIIRHDHHGFFTIEPGIRLQRIGRTAPCRRNRRDIGVARAFRVILE